MHTLPLAGFLGTDASVASDLTLLAYIFLLVPSMVVGFIFARRRVFFSHQITMTAITLFNWLLIIFVMVISYVKNVAPRIPAGLNMPFYLSPSIHLLFGLCAQIIATILVGQMWLGPHFPFRLEPIKRWMRLTITLWFLTAILGVLTYITWYGAPFTSGVGRNLPVETNIPNGGISPVGTLAATQDASSTQEATTQPAVTAEATQSATESATKQAIQTATPEATKAK